MLRYWRLQAAAHGLEEAVHIALVDAAWIAVREVLEALSRPAARVPARSTSCAKTPRATWLTFVAAPRGPRYAGRLPLPEVARTLARAAGHWGSTAAYLYNTVAKLEEHGIRDRNLWTLQELVADEIRRLGRAVA